MNNVHSESSQILAPLTRRLYHPSWVACGFLLLVLWAVARGSAQEVPRLPNPGGGAIILPQQQAGRAQVEEAMREMMQRRQAVAQGRNIVPEEAEADEATNIDSSEKFPYGGMLSTNPDVIGILEKAERYKDEGNYRTAGRFWQAAMKQAGDSLYTRDGEFYFPMVKQIESIIAQLPPEGLEVYRVSADADAAGFLAEGQGGGEQRIEALQKVVDLAFLSSQGDDAALELATYHLDRFESVSAESLLKQILESYPAPDVPLEEVWLKLAVAKALLGDAEAAQAALEQARQLNEGGGRLSAGLLGQIQQLVASPVPSAVSSGRTDGNWSSPLGLGRGIQQAPPLSADYLENDLAAAWVYRQQLREWNIGPRDAHIQGEVRLNPLGRTDFLTEKWNEQAEREADRRLRRDTTRESILREWENSDWQSASRPLVVDGKVVFKSQADLSAWSTDLKLEPEFNSLWLNRYAPDPLSYQFLNQTRSIQNSYPAARRLDYRNLETMQFFGDDLFQSMTCYDGVVYSIEGERYDRDERMPSVVGRSINIWSAAPTRDRSCYLVAYDLASGKALWNQPFPAGEETAEFKSAAILGPAVGFRDQVLVPVLAGSRFFLVGIDRTTGTMRWKQTICDSPSLSTSALTMVQLAIEGNDVFMTCGTGILAKANASTGQIAWIRRYQRSVADSSPNTNARVFGLNREWMNKDIDGWRHDLVFVWGPWVIMAASDQDDLIAFERGSGVFAWRAPRSNVLGCTVDQWLGVKDGVLYATGTRGLLAYELEAEGRLYGQPQRLMEPVTGRGVILDQGIVLPVGHQLKVFDLHTLKEVRGIDVAMPDRSPIGSLVSDGTRLWSAAMGTLVALETVSGSGAEVPAEEEMVEEDESDAEEDSLDESREDDDQTSAPRTPVSPSLGS